MKIPRILVAAGAGLALADASVVTLALPELIVELDTTVEGVAAVLAVYTLVLAAALIPAERFRLRVGSRFLGVWGFIVFAAAGAGCGVVDSLAPLLVLRGAQALGAAAGLVCGFDFLTAGERSRERLWTAAVVLGAAVGPALGGLLTELFDWRAIFLVQAPIGVLAALAFLDRGEATIPLGSQNGARGEPRRAYQGIELGPAIALALVSAALSAVLFLLVLLLVSGWSISPLEAALAVTILPVAALVGMRITGEPRLRAAAGCGLVGAGILALASLGSASVAWIVLPQLMAGLGMGLALTSLIGPLLPEQTPGQTAVLLAIRHAGITLALLLLAPITAAQIDDAVADTRERGAALVLDAELPPLDKIELANAVTADLDPVDPRGTLSESLDASGESVGDDPEGAAVYADLARHADETLVAGIDEAFSLAFLVTGALALLGALAVLARRDPRTLRLSLVVVGSALVLSACQAAIAVSARPDPVVIADPCQGRDLPGTGGIGGFVQDAALVGLDRAACEFGSSREELAIALVDDEAAQSYEAEHGVDPRAIDELARGALGF
ncbi:MAG: MFS transporter [Solirubrobacterales bacterium]